MDPDDGLFKDRGRIQVISPLFITVDAIRNEEEPSCSWIHVLISACICEKIIIWVFNIVYMMFHMDYTNI